MNMSSFQKNNQICFEGKENKTWFIKKIRSFLIKEKKMKDFIKKKSDMFLCKVKRKKEVIFGL